MALNLGSHGRARVWKLRAPRQVTRPADTRWSQSSSIPIMSFGFVPRKLQFNYLGIT